MSDIAGKSPSTGDASGIYLDGTYLEKTQTWHAEDSPWKAGQIHRILSSNHIQPKTVGEVGCGAGEILVQLSLKMPDTDFSGFEISPQAFDLCQQRASGKRHFMRKNVLAEDVFFDVMLCIDVFEHVPDYMGFIKALRPKATYKVFHIPLDISVSSVLRDAMMTARNAVGHLHYFTATTAVATLKDCGYEIIDQFYTTAFDGLPSRTLKGKAARLARKVLYAMSPDLAVKLVGGCSLLVLAR